jgi:hypothetical protein
MGELYLRLSIPVLATLALASPGPSRVGAAGVTVALPSGWHATQPIQGAVTNPLTRIVVASAPVRPNPKSSCQFAAYAFPQTAVAIVVVEWTRQIDGVKIGIGPGRPRRFTAANLPLRPANIECFPGRGGSIEFPARHHTFAAYVMLGTKASARLADHARGVLDTLRIAPR